MYSCLIVALFAVLSLAGPVPSSLSAPRHHSHSANCSHTFSSGPVPTPAALPNPPSSAQPSPPSSAQPSPPSSAPPSSAPSSAPVIQPAPSSSVPSFTSSAASSPSPASALTSGANGPFTGGVATFFYQDGTPGACGSVNPDSALICAIDQARFGTSGPGSSLCGSKVQITNLENGKTVTVTVADDCPTCKNSNSIDLSVGAFTALQPDLGVGEFSISWQFV